MKNFIKDSKSIVTTIENNELLSNGKHIINFTVFLNEKFYIEGIIYYTIDYEDYKFPMYDEGMEIVKYNGFDEETISIIENALFEKIEDIATAMTDKSIENIITEQIKSVLIEELEENFI